MIPTPWIVRKPGVRRRMRIYCFSCAGGNAHSYLPWQDLLSARYDICAVQLPGRGARFDEIPFDTLTELVSAFVDVFRRHSDQPFAFFGHSLGALIAFEVARKLHALKLEMPRHLFVAGCSAPQCRGEQRFLHRLPDAELVEELKSYDGTPHEVISNQELMALVLPAIRSDFALAENYAYKASDVLKVPISVLAGKGDEHTTGEMEGWRLETSGPCRVQWFEGRHFFINSERDAVLAYLQEKLGEHPC